MLTINTKAAQIYQLALVLYAGIAGSAVLQLSWRESSNSAVAGTFALAASGGSPAVLR